MKKYLPARHHHRDRSWYSPVARSHRCRIIVFLHNVLTELREKTEGIEERLGGNSLGREIMRDHLRDRSMNAVVPESYGTSPE